jgi:hypothetical protein
MRRNRPLAVFLAFDAVALVLLAMFAGISHPDLTAALAGVLGAVAYVQWRGPRKG